MGKLPRFLFYRSIGKRTSVISVAIDVRKLVYKFIKFITSLIIISFSSGFDSAIINVMATNVPSLNRLALFKNKTLFLSKNSKKRDAAIL